MATVTGNLTLGGTLNITDAGGFITNTYALFTYTGVLTYNSRWDTHLNARGSAVVAGTLTAALAAGRAPVR